MPWRLTKSTHPPYESIVQHAEGLGPERGRQRRHLPRIRLPGAAFPLRGEQEADAGMASKRLGAEDGWGDDARAANAAALQQPGTAIAGDQVVSLTCQGHCQQELYQKKRLLYWQL